jgi:hypothetical protein
MPVRWVVGQGVMIAHRCVAGGVAVGVAWGCVNV